MFSLIVFDLDGTLVDSRRDIAESANALLEACGARPLPDEAIGRMVGNGATTLVARAFEAAGIDTLAYRGRRVRVRGWLESYNGPMIEATHPAQIEVLGE